MPTCLGGATCGRHGLRWWIQPNRSSSDWHRLGHFVLWVVIIRRTQFGWGKGHLIHLVRSHLLGQQTSPSEHQSSKPGWGQWLIAQAITKRSIKPRRPVCTCSIPPVSILFNFSNQGQSPWATGPSTPIEQWGVPNCNPRPLYQEWGLVLQKDWGQGQLELWPVPPPLPLPSPDCGFESDQSLASTSSMVSARSDRCGGSRHSHHGWKCHRESGGHMKINLPVFKDEDMRDAVTYQSWHWDLTVYHHAGCWDCTLLPYTICSLQGYPGELVRSLWKDVTLEDVFAILDEHYNNVKALDALNQELFQLWMGEKETVLDWGVHLSEDTGWDSSVGRAADLHVRGPGFNTHSHLSLTRVDSAFHPFVGR